MGGYLQQRASSWVSFAVLSGGLVSALILFVVVQIEGDIEVMEERYYEENLTAQLEAL